AVRPVVGDVLQLEAPTAVGGVALPGYPRIGGVIRGAAGPRFARVAIGEEAGDSPGLDGGCRGVEVAVGAGILVEGEHEAGDRRPCGDGAAVELEESLLVGLAADDRHREVASGHVG